MSICVLHLILLLHFFIAEQCGDRKYTDTTKEHESHHDDLTCKRQGGCEPQRQAYRCAGGKGLKQSRQQVRSVADQEEGAQHSHKKLHRHQGKGTDHIL